MGTLRHLRVLHRLPSVGLILGLLGCGSEPPAVPAMGLPKTKRSAEFVDPIPVRVLNTKHAVTPRPLAGMSQPATGIFAGHDHPIRKIRCSNDGRWLATTAAGESTIQIWDVATGRLVHRLQGHTGPVADLAFSNHGEKLASVSMGERVVEDGEHLQNHVHGELKLWDIETGIARPPMVGAIPHPSTVAFTDDDLSVMATGFHFHARESRFWRIETRKLRRVNGSETDVAVVRAMLTSHGKVGFFDASGAVEWYSLTTGERVGREQIHPQSIEVAAISPDRKWLATGSMDQTVALVATEGDGSNVVLRGFQHGITSVTFSADGKRLAATAAGENQVLFWDLNRAAELSREASSSRKRDASSDLTPTLFPDLVLTLPNQFGPATFRCAEFAASGNVLMTGVENRLITWEIDPSNPELRPFQSESQEQLATLEGHRDRVLRVRFTPDGRYLASWSPDRVLKLWDVATRTEIKAVPEMRGGIVSWTFSPDHQTFATGASSTERGEKAPAIRIQDFAGTLRTRTVVDRPLVQFVYDNTIKALDYSPDGQLLASVTADGMARLWDPTKLVDHRNWIDAGEPLSSATFTGDGTNLLLATPRGRVHLYRIDPPSFEHVFDVPEDQELVRLAVSRDRKLLAVLTAVPSHENERKSGPRPGQLRIWDTRTRESLAEMTIPFEGTFEVNFSPDGSSIVTSGPGSAISVWELRSQKKRATLEGHGEPVTTLTFSPDGKILASGSRDRTLRFWDAVTYRELATRRGHHNALTMIMFSPDGTLVASGSVDRTVRLWKAPSR